MIKVILFLLLFKPSTGEVIGTYQTPDGNPPGFATFAECETAKEAIIATRGTPPGFAQRGYCVQPQILSEASKL